MGFVYAYLMICLLLLSWLLAFAYVGMDEYDRRYISWGETVGMAILSALFWPVILIRKPGILRKPSEIYERDSHSATMARERDRIHRELERCSNRVRFDTSKDGKLIGEFEFPSDAIGSYLARRTENDGYGSLPDLPEIQAWVNNADYMNGQPSEVPWVWGSFKLLATELIEKGVGSCFCGTCRAHYESRVLESGTGNGSPGWIAAIVKCPQGHEVMKFDLMKPFCSHRRNYEPDSGQTTSPETHIPNFLKKGQ